jgi:hypothetical protein
MGNFLFVHEFFHLYFKICIFLYSTDKKENKFSSHSDGSGGKVMYEEGIPNK